jgi:hypothetical protein
MVRTSVFFRPDAREADLVRVGTLYLSRTSDRRLVYTSFMADDAELAKAIAATASDAMRAVLANFSATFLRVLSGVPTSSLECEEAVAEAAFRLLPTNLRHDRIEEYPAEDFFVRVVSEREEERAKKLDPSNVVAADPQPLAYA